MKHVFILSAITLWVFSLSAQELGVDFLEKDKSGVLSLSEKGASHFARLALHCMQRQYPNKLNQVLSDSNDLQPPRVLHPAFYGCFDWHSSVHGHWMLVRLLKQFPDMAEAEQIRDKLNENLTAENLEGEVAYFKSSSKSWERMYGWSWLMKLAEELHAWDDPDGKRWSANLQPLVEAIRERYFEFLPVQAYPVRTGVHPNTAFGMTFAWDYAVKTNDAAFRELLEERASAYFQADENCPAAWEPSGEDFLSACLEEANLMRRVLPPTEFEAWFARFLPGDQLATLLTPADVSDRSDPKIVHLDGLNLSRAWCMYGLVASLTDEQLKEEIILAAQRHLQATLPHVASDHYEGSHWLASFAVYALSSSE